MDVEYLMSVAYASAARSPDKSNQCGAVVCDAEGDPFGIGYNHFTPGIDPEWALEDRDRKLFYIEHAERDAIFDAAQNGPTKGLTMVCPWAACADCGRAIVLSGIRTLVVHKQRMDTTPERWVKSIEAALDMIRSGGVEIEYFDGPVRGAGAITVNGELWSPVTGEVCGTVSST